MVLSSERIFEGVGENQERSWNLASVIEGLFKGLGRLEKGGFCAGVLSLHSNIKVCVHHRYGSQQ